MRDPVPARKIDPPRDVCLREAPEAEGGLTTFIYTLRHPETGAVGYVGASAKPNEQLSKNLYHAKIRTIGPLFDWLRELLFAGLRPSVTLVREVLKRDAEAHVQIVKEAFRFVTPPRRPRGPALRYPHDLRRFTPMVPEDFHFRGRTTPDMRDPYIRTLKANLRKYGPKLRSTRSSPVRIPPNTPEMNEMARKTARMILKSKSWKRPRNSPVSAVLAGFPTAPAQRGGR